MRHRTTALAVLLTLSLACTTLIPNVAYGETTGSDAGAGSRLLVQFRDGTSAAAKSATHQRAGLRVIDTIPQLNIHVVEVPVEAVGVRSSAYSLDANVQLVESDHIATTTDAPDDPYYDGTRQWGLFQIDADGAWDITHSRSDIRIAILDTGIQSTHPDLAAKIVAAADFTGSGSPEPVSNSHGTHVAGIAAASTNNAIGVAGLGRNASLINAKVMKDDGTGYYSWIAAGIVWATDNGADVINMSLSGTSSSSVLLDAVNYAWEHGVLVVAAAGNDGSSSPRYPAAYPNCVSVAASTSTDELASWSNYGASWVDVSAPSWAYSTKIGGYTSMQGTSMASPYVAGLAALVLDIADDVNGNGRLNDEVRAAIESTCVDIGINVQYGRIDAAAAVGTGYQPTTGEIAGVVVDANSDLPIQGASVTDGARSDLTDGQGAYTLTGVPAGTHTVTASMDNYDASSQHVTVTVGETATANFALDPETIPNRAPVLGPIGHKAVDEDSLLSFTVAATDADGDALTFSAAPLPQGATFANRVFSWTPVDNQNGSYNVIFSVSDGEFTDSESNTITVNAIARYGAITGAVTDAASGSPVQGATVSAGGLSTTTGADGSYEIAGVPEGSHLVTATAGGYYGDETQASVAPSQSTTVSFQLQAVPPPNRAPVLGPIGHKTVDQDSLLSFTVTATDPDGDALMFDASTLPNGATFANRVFSWTPVDNQNGSYAVTFSVSDGELQDSESITITVNAIARYGAITGTVTNAASGSPIEGATVSAAGLSTATGADGSYEIAGVPEGSCIVTVIANGYYDHNMTVDVPAEEEVVAHVSLSASGLPTPPTHTIALTLATGWNMVSVPLVLSDDAPSAVFPGAVAIYAWDPALKSFAIPGSIEPHRGYWVAISTANTFNLTGIPVTEWSASLAAGWNMVGSVYGNPVDVAALADDPPGSVVKSAVYHWNPDTRSYETASKLFSGRAYWIATTHSYDLTVTAPG